MGGSEGALEKGKEETKEVKGGEEKPCIEPPSLYHPSVFPPLSIHSSPFPPTPGTRITPSPHFRPHSSSPASTARSMVQSSNRAALYPHPYHNERTERETKHHPTLASLPPPSSHPRCALYSNVRICLFPIPHPMAYPIMRQSRSTPFPTATVFPSREGAGWLATLLLIAVIHLGFLGPPEEEGGGERGGEGGIRRIYGGKARERERWVLAKRGVGVGGFGMRVS